MAPTSVLSTSFQLNGHQTNLLLEIKIILLVVIKTLIVSIITNRNNFVIDEASKNCGITESDSKTMCN